MMPDNLELIFMSQYNPEMKRVLEKYENVMSSRHTRDEYPVKEMHELGALLVSGKMESSNQNYVALMFPDAQSRMAWKLSVGMDVDELYDTICTLYDKMVMLGIMETLGTMKDKPLSNPNPCSEIFLTGVVNVDGNCSGDVTIDPTENPDDE